VYVFVLNVLAFVLIGFQLKSIVARLDRSTLFEYLWVEGWPRRTPQLIVTLAAALALPIGENS
jgi:hypothetical protein